MVKIKNKRNNKKSKSKSKSKSKRQLDFIYNPSIRNNLTSSTFAWNLVKIIEENSGEEIKCLLNKIIDSPVAVKLMKYKGFTCESIGKTERFPEIRNKSKEIIYLTNIFLKNSDDIKIFMEERNKFDKEYVKGNIDNAIKILKKIEDKQGITIWGIENNIYCTYDQLGIEGVKNLCNYYKKNIKNGFILFLIDLFFGKVEGNNPDLCLKGKSSVINEFRSSGDIETGDVISYFVMPLEYDNGRKLYKCLMYLSNMPIFDQYLLFRQAITESILINEKEIYNNNIIQSFYKKSCLELNPNEYYNSLTEEKNYLIDKNVKEVVHDYTIGEYESSYIKAKDLIENDIKYMSLMGIYAKSLILSRKYDIGFNKNSILYRLSDCMININTLSNDCASYFQKIEMLLIRYTNQHWTWSIFPQLYDMYPDIFSKYSLFSHDKMILSFVYLTPKTFYYIKKEKIDFFEFITSLLEISNKDVIPLSRLKKHNVYSGSINGFNITETIENDAHLLPYEIKKIKAKTYINSEKIEEACKYIVEECIQNNNIYRLMPFHEVFNLVDANKYKLNSIYFPILYYLYSRNISDDRDNLLNEAYEDYIELLEVNKPSEYFSSKYKISFIEKFFLRYVCIPSIMDISPNFQSKDELLSERIKIINILKGLENSEDKKQLNAEIDNILTEIIIDKSTEGIRKSKIHVDIEKFKQTKYSYYSELYRIYNLTPENQDIDKDILFEFNTSDTNFFSLSDSKDALLMKLITEFIHDFAADPGFGLNKYLSADIRHGFFINQLRARLESHCLITDKCNDSYQDNKFWINKYNIVPSHITNKVNKILKKFSKDYDNILIEAQSKIDVSVDTNKDNKLFFYFIEYDEFQGIKKSLENVDSFSTFFEYLTDLLFKKTDDCLIKVREWLYSDLLLQLDHCFESLLSDLTIAKSTIAMNELEDVIRSAKNGIRDDISTVLEWFTRNTDIQISDLQMHHAIVTSINSFIALHNPKQINIKYTPGGKEKFVILNNSEYKHLILALITAYNNSLQYGVNCTDYPISIVCNIGENYEWEIQICNRCSEITNKSKLEHFRDIITKSKNHNLAIQEGGTGLYKINTLITQTFINSMIDFEIDNLNFFILKIRKI